MKSALLASMLIVLAAPAVAEVHVAPRNIQPAGVRIEVGPGEEGRHHNGGDGGWYDHRRDGHCRRVCWWSREEHRRVCDWRCGHHGGGEDGDRY